MTRFEFSITIGASAVNLATAAFLGLAGEAYPNGHLAVFGSSYLPAARLEVYLDVGSTGSAYFGGSDVTTAGLHKSYDAAPGTGANTGSAVLLQDYGEDNSIDLASWWVNGGNIGDKVVVIYYQA